jgi:hypothetical protein
MAGSGLSKLALGGDSEQDLPTRTDKAVRVHIESQEGLGDYVRTIGRVATRVGLSLGFVVCLSVIGISSLGAFSASAQTCGYGYGYNSSGCTTTTVAVATSTGSATTSSGQLALTGEQVAVPLAAAAGLLVIVLAARQLRRRANN